MTTKLKPTLWDTLPQLLISLVIGWAMVWNIGRIVLQFVNGH